MTDNLEQPQSDIRDRQITEFRSFVEGYGKEIDPRDNIVVAATYKIERFSNRMSHDASFAALGVSADTPQDLAAKLHDRPIIKSIVLGEEVGNMDVSYAVVYIFGEPGRQYPRTQHLKLNKKWIENRTDPPLREFGLSVVKIFGEKPDDRTVEIKVPVKSMASSTVLGRYTFLKTNWKVVSVEAKIEIVEERELVIEEKRAGVRTQMIYRLMDNTKADGELAVILETRAHPHIEESTKRPSFLFRTPYDQHVSFQRHLELESMLREMEEYGAGKLKPPFGGHEAVDWAIDNWLRTGRKSGTKKEVKKQAFDDYKKHYYASTAFKFFEMEQDELEAERGKIQEELDGLTRIAEENLTRAQEEWTTKDLPDFINENKGTVDRVIDNRLV